MMHILDLCRRFRWCRFSGLSAIAVGLAILTNPATAVPSVGQPAPTFTATDSNGATHNLADFKGKTVVLEWTNHECPYTVKHYDSGNMQSLQKETTTNGAIWLSIISSAPGRQGYVTADQANKLTTARDAAPTAVLIDPDGSIGKLYEAKTTPHMYIIDGGGTLVYMGAIDDDPSSHGSPSSATNYVRAALADMEFGRSVQTAATRAYGCSVKYGN